MYKPFAAPWRLLWPTLWWLAVLLVVALSLVPTPQGLDLPRNSDKVQHLLAYGVLAAAAVQVFRQGRVLLLVAVGRPTSGPTAQMNPLWPAGVKEIVWWMSPSPKTPPRGPAGSA